MKVAILGGTGFMGYSLVRRLLNSDAVTPVVYGSSPKSLVNLARHDVDFRYVPTSKLGGVRFRMTLRGQLLEVDVGKEATTYTLRDGEDLTIFHGDEEIRLSPGTPAVEKAHTTTEHS